MREGNSENWGTITDTMYEFSSGNWRIAVGDILLHINRTRSFAGVVPAEPCEDKRRALIASTLNHLSLSMGIECPTWAKAAYSLPEPWFPSGLVSMRAMALLQSPISFRRNGIFVTNEFFARV